MKIFDELVNWFYLKMKAELDRKTEMVIAENEYMGKNEENEENDKKSKEKDRKNKEKNPMVYFTIPRDELSESTRGWVI